jgi:hypothetical protein
MCWWLAGWSSLLKVTRSRKSLRKAYWEPQASLATDSGDMNSDEASLLQCDVSED